MTETTQHKQRIAARFAAAVASYDEASPIQRRAAQQLADKVAALTLPTSPRVLEIGCGTGHLTSELMPRIGGTWFVSDIAPAMALACRQHCPAASFVVMDGERPAFAPASFDLIVSSLSAQWFADLPATLAALAGLLVPGGQMALATLGAGTFAEWQAAHAACGLTAATPRYPSAAQLAQAFPAALAAQLSEQHLADPAQTPLDFMRGLRAIGAHTPPPGVPPLTAGQLRRVMRALPALAPQGVSYRLLYALAQRPGAAVSA